VGGTGGTNAFAQVPTLTMCLTLAAASFQPEGEQCSFPLPSPRLRPTASSACTSKTIRLGFRTVELVRQPLQDAAARLLPPTQQQQAGGRVPTSRRLSSRREGADSAAGGESFYFQVNGMPLFAKVSCQLVLTICGGEGGT
jgi:hypothetical protein